MLRYCSAPPSVPNELTESSQDGQSLPAAQRASCANGLPRLPQLDALRGVAALVVVMHHAILSLRPDDPLHAWVTHIPSFNVLILGRPAVQLFYVLSGFVLTLSLLASSEGWLRFALRRCFRLLPAYWVSLGIAGLLFALTPVHLADQMSDWFYNQWTPAMGGVDVLKHATMQAGPDGFPLNHVAWSLVHELRLSLILPLAILTFRGVGALIWIGIAVACRVFSSVVADQFPADFPPGIYGFLFDANELDRSVVVTGQFLVCFVTGVFLALRYAGGIDRTAGRVWIKVTAIVIGVCALSQSNETGMTLGAGALVYAVVQSQRIAFALSLRPLVWLGRVSYSLYLVHLPLMLTCGFVLTSIVSPRVALTIAIAVSFMLAEIMYRFVEAPGLKFGRAIIELLPRSGKAAIGGALSIAGSKKQLRDQRL